MKRKAAPKYSSSRKWLRRAGQVAAYYYGGEAGAYAYDQLMPTVSTQTNWPPSYGNGTLTKGKLQGGKKVSRKSNKYVKKLVRAAASRIVFGLTGATEYGGAYGQYVLRNYWDSRANTNAGAGGYYLPIHLWDVSAVTNSTINADTLINAQCGYRIGLTSPATPYEPRHRSLGPALEVVTSPGPSVNAYNAAGVRAGSLLRGVKAKIMFYAPLKLPVRVKVMLIQLMDDVLHPSKNPSVTDPIEGRLDQGQYVADNTLLPNDTGTALRAAGNFWGNVAKSYVSNPVVMGSSDDMIKKNMKILRKQEFILNPKETVDNANTTYHMVDFYHAFNRKQVYNWENTDQSAMALENNSYFRAQTRCCVQPKARIYLMIVADGTYGTAAAEPPANDADYNASYDISLRLYHDDITG